jgi:hypothetical protein
MIGRQALKVDVRFEPVQRFRVRSETHGLARATSSRRLSHFVARRFLLAHRSFGYDALDDIAPSGHVVHRFQQHVLQDGTKSARARAPLEGEVSDRVERLFFDDEFDAVHREDLLELLHERVLRLGQDLNQHVAVELLHR